MTSIENPTNPSLRHAQKRKPNPNQQRPNPTQPPRHALLILPRPEIISARKARPEPEILDEQDAAEANGPVAEQGEEVLEDAVELVAPAPGQGEQDAREEGAPEEAWDGHEVFAPELDG